MENAKLSELSHTVLFWLAREGSQDDARVLAGALKGLSAIPEVRAIHVGTPAATASDPVVDSSFGVSAILFFDDVESEAVYQSHPLHTKFIAENQHLWSKVVVYDAIKA